MACGYWPATGHVYARMFDLAAMHNGRFPVDARLADSAPRVNLHAVNVTGITACRRVAGVSARYSPSPSRSAIARSRSAVADWYVIAILGSVWPRRAISSRTVAPDRAAMTAPACLKSCGLISGRLIALAAFATVAKYCE